MSLALGDTGSHQSADVPQVEVWDTGKTWEPEYRLHPDPSIDEISSRLFNQVTGSRYYRSGLTREPVIIKILS